MKTTMNCRHLPVQVTYVHPHGDIVLTVAALKASPPELTRPSMTLQNPECVDCGQALPRKVLRSRIAQGGDLFDARFQFSWKSRAKRAAVDV